MVKTLDVVGALTIGDPFCCFYDRAKDEVTWIGEDELRAAEDVQEGDDLVEVARHTESGEVEALELAIRIIADHDDTQFVPLPTQWDVNEHGIMEDFVQTLPESELQQRLWDDLHHSGAFRHFKDRVHRVGLADAWYRYRDKRLSQIARDWAEENDVRLT